MPSSRGSLQPRDQIESLNSPSLAGGLFIINVTWEAHYYRVLICK